MWVKKWRCEVLNFLKYHRFYLLLILECITTETVVTRNILHLSTHGLSDLDNPLNSHLQFKDSNLSLLEIHALKLDINLVILSACETNLSTINGADEVLAFERAFLIAGAKNIITTFLSVDSDRTIDFMRVFYEKTAKNNSISKTFQQTCIDDIHEHGSSEWMLFRFTGV